MKKVLIAAIMLIFIGSIQNNLWSADNVPRMTKEQLKDQLGNSNVIIVDVRTPNDWKEADSKIKGATYEDPLKIGQWMSKYPKDKTIVFYCA